jgi:hypothetical protein
VAANVLAFESSSYLAKVLWALRPNRRSASLRLASDKTLRAVSAAIPTLNMNFANRNARRAALMRALAGLRFGLTSTLTLRFTTAPFVGMVT